MSFKDGLRKTWDTLGEVADALAKSQRAEQEASRLLGMSEPVARRELKRMSETLDSDVWRLMIGQFDTIAQNDSGRRADMAARLAEYAESLLLARFSASGRKPANRTWHETGYVRDVVEMIREAMIREARSASRRGVAPPGRYKPTGRPGEARRTCVDDP